MWCVNILAHIIPSYNFNHGIGQRQFFFYIMEHRLLLYLHDVSHNSCEFLIMCMTIMQGQSDLPIRHFQTAQSFWCDYPSQDVDFTVRH